MRVWRLLGPILALLCLPVADAHGGIVRYVNATDPTCGGQSPCATTIQAGVNAAQAGDTVRIQAGSYTEQVLIASKNTASGATEADRIVIQADPGAPLGSVVLQGAVTQCSSGHAIQIRQSKFITIRGAGHHGRRRRGDLVAGRGQPEPGDSHRAQPHRRQRQRLLQRGHHRRLRQPRHPDRQQPHLW
jgi:hypothetical protein